MPEVACARRTKGARAERMALARVPKRRVHIPKGEFMFSWVK
jgi:hypothetical protein